MYIEENLFNLYVIDYYVLVHDDVLLLKGDLYNKLLENLCNK